MGAALSSVWACRQYRWLGELLPLPMAAVGRCQWEALEQDLAEAIGAFEAPRLCPRKSALGFPPRWQHPLELPRPGRAFSADAAETRGGLLWSLAQDLVAKDWWHLSSTNCSESFEEVAAVPDEEAPLATALAGTGHYCQGGVSNGTPQECCEWLPEGSPSRGDVLAWQLPGRPCRGSAAISPYRGAGTRLEVCNEACFVSAVCAASSVSSSSATAQCLTSTSIGHALVERGVAGSEQGDAPRAAHIGGNGGASVRAEASSLSLPQVSLPSTGPGRRADSIQRSRVEAPQRLLRRPFTTDLVLDVPRSSLGLRTTLGFQEAVESAVAASISAKLERCTVAAPYRKPMLLAAPAEAAECAICMDSFLEGEMIRTLPCCHRFHASCLDPWLTCRWQCPLCKHEVA